MRFSTQTALLVIFLTSSFSIGRAEAESVKFSDCIQFLDAGGNLIIPKAISPAGVSANAVLNAFCIDESDRDADSAGGQVNFSFHITKDRDKLTSAGVSLTEPDPGLSISDSIFLTNINFTNDGGADFSIFLCSTDASGRCAAQTDSILERDLFQPITSYLFPNFKTPPFTVNVRSDAEVPITTPEPSYVLALPIVLLAIFVLRRKPFVFPIE